MSGATRADGDGPLAIVCGGGNLPFAVANAARRRGREVVVYAIRGWADAEKVSAYPHQWGGLGQFGHFCRFARKHGCRDVVFIGTLTRPSIWRIWPDLKALALVLKFFAAFRGGDNHLLSSIGRIFEQEGFRILGAHEVAPEILMPLGVIGQIAPRDRDVADIACGLAVLDAIGPFDVGQAAVIANNHVLAIEGVEGTDLLLERIAGMRRLGRIVTPEGIGVIVKAPKRGQDVRFDLPSIGPKMVEGAVAAGLAGIAVVAGGSIVAEPERLAELADRSRIFVAGVRSDGTLG